MRVFALLSLALTAACSTPQGSAPSLAPRASEAVDPRVPIAGHPVSRAVDPTLAARLAELIGRARQGEAEFAAAAAEASRLAAAAGAAQSESWIVAQQAVSAAVATRAPVTRALGDIDEIAATALARQGAIGAADLAAIEAAAAEVGAVDRRQAQIVDSLQARLGG